jgi:hypothetical protein
MKRLRVLRQTDAAQPAIDVNVRSFSHDALSA